MEISAWILCAVDSFVSCLSDLWITLQTVPYLYPSLLHCPSFFHFSHCQVQKEKNPVNLFPFSSKNLQKEYFLSSFKLVTAFWIRLRWPGCLWASLFCLIDWLWIQFHTSTLCSKSKALFYSGYYLVTSQLRTLVELWRESNSIISSESIWAGASCYILGKKKESTNWRTIYNSWEINRKVKTLLLKSSHD